MILDDKICTIQNEPKEKKPKWSEHENKNCFWRIHKQHAEKMMKPF